MCKCLSVCVSECVCLCELCEVVCMYVCVCELCECSLFVGDLFCFMLSECDYYVLSLSVVVCG